MDNFLSLKEGRAGDGSCQRSQTSQRARLQLRDGRFRLEVDLQDFRPEDIEICVEVIHTERRRVLHRCVRDVS